MGWKKRCAFGGLLAVGYVKTHRREGEWVSSGNSRGLDRVLSPKEVV